MIIGYPRSFTGNIIGLISTNCNCRGMQINFIDQCGVIRPFGSGAKRPSQIANCDFKNNKRFNAEVILDGK